MKVRFLPLQQILKIYFVFWGFFIIFKIMDKEKIFKELDRWISDKGDGKYMDIDFNCYSAVQNNLLNDEFAIQQNKEELEKFVDILLKSNRETCLEIGLGFFGSTHFLWRHIYEKVITIEKNFERVRQFGRNMKSYYGKWVMDDGRSLFFNGFSNDENIVSSVYNKIDEVDFLFIDGNHSYNSVLCDFLLYYPLVKSGGIVAFHDTALSEDNMGVPQLIAEIRTGRYTNGKRINMVDIIENKWLGITYFYKS